MKKMKKLLAGFMAATMVMSMSVTALAAEYDAYLDKKAVVPKTYTINNGTSPAETFTYKFEPQTFVNGDKETYTYNKTTGQFEMVESEGTKTVAANSINDLSIAFDALSTTTSKTVEVPIDASQYELGVYTYKVTEVIPNPKTAGVSYSEESLYLVLSILRDESSNKHFVAAMHYQNATGQDKSTGFTNTYDSGSLAITKEITGNMADMTKKFTFTVTFKAPEGETLKSTIETDNTTTNRTYAVTTENGVTTYTFELGDGETATFKNLPKGTIYTVSENAENYTSDNGVFSDTGKTIAANDNDTVVFTNTLTNTVDTGISLDNMPYIMVLALVALGLVGFVSKKRSMEF